MWVLVRRPDGSEEETVFPEDAYLDIGDILEDGAVVVEIRRHEDDDIDELGYFSDELDEDYL